jgi:hypothetical protein
LLINCKQLRWNFTNIATEDQRKEKIWSIAQERYKGWRSNLSATYKAYNSYGERIRNKPEEVDLVEWHYLQLYFGSDKFKVSYSKSYFVEQIISTNVELLHTYEPLVPLCRRLAAKTPPTVRSKETII